MVKASEFVLSCDLTAFKLINSYVENMAKKAKQQVQEESNADTTMDASMVETEDKKSAEKQRYAELLNHVSIIAQPMASRKLTRKIYKLLKKGNL